MVLKNDPVHYPMHYTQGKVECIDAIESSMTLDAFCGFLKGNALKYIQIDRCSYRGENR